MVERREDLIAYLENGKAGDFAEVFSLWFRTPNVNTYSLEHEEHETIVVQSGFRRFMDPVIDEVERELKSWSHNGAIDVIRLAIGRLGEINSERVRGVAEAQLWFGAGHIFFHQASEGDFRNKPVSTPKNRELFLRAATCYMMADIALGSTGYYDLMIALAFGGANEQKFASLVLAKSGAQISVVHPDDLSVMAEIRALQKSARDEDSGELPGGGKYQFLRDDSFFDVDQN